MNGRRSILFVACVALAAAARADTLTLRDGTIFTGSWAGISDGQISFLANDRLLTYPRSEVLQVTFGSAPAKPPVTVKPGQTIEEVTAALGQPKSVQDQGAVKTYTYPNVKITFTNGKVTNIE